MLDLILSQPKTWNTLNILDNGVCIKWWDNDDGNWSNPGLSKSFCCLVDQKLSAQPIEGGE